MTSQGPPLRFKAVNTETGESSEHLYDIFRIVSTNHILHLQVADYNCDKFTFRFNNPSFNSRPKAKVEICQSTGLHDAKGREIFFGDVLLIYNPLSSLNGLWVSAEYGLGLGICLFKRFCHDTGEQYHFNAISKNAVSIGNRHESREVLEQKARGVMGRE